MIRKIGSILLGLSVIGIVSIGVNSSFTYQASHADFPSPQRPDFVQSVDASKDYSSTTAEKAL
ncbi:MULTISPECIES: Phr family secreted Rap phosphatase inhibitor [Bacillus]|uniref:Phr family secreted Rap phosphatase inhibitor n=1 Tax=Bacillus TaxID=1386 RepID=UPI000BECFB8B|nr:MULTISPECIES: Phr family secreted Rap phosphatase inhibitor [Bacillus]PEF33163.1 Phr family secreted Rap phosphatase inhibitor [Bacillus wiedmannii]